MNTCTTTPNTPVTFIYSGDHDENLAYEEINITREKLEKLQNLSERFTNMYTTTASKKSA